MDDGEEFLGLQTDLENAAETLFLSSPCHQPLRFETLVSKTTQPVPPMPSTALQNKIESKLEKSLSASLKIEIQQQMGGFQASMLKAMKSLRDEFKTMENASEVSVDQAPTSNKMTCPPVISVLKIPTSGHLCNQMSPWTWTCMGLLSLKVRAWYSIQAWLRSN